MLGKIILAILTRDLTDLNSPLRLLKDAWGEEEARSEIIPFTFSNYYEKEMGRGLLRLWLSFAKPYPCEKMVALKILTAAVERRFLKDGGRVFNLDPGIITLSNLCLLTHKNYTHRIYLGEGVFCELTLLYKKGSFQPLPWTYPDYKTKVAIDFFNAVRERLKNEKKS